MTVGKVKWYSETQGYGCILQMDGREIYFHYTAIAENGDERNLPIGTTVTYDLIETRVGPEATNVKRSAPSFV